MISGIKRTYLPFSREFHEAKRKRIFDITLFLITIKNAYSRSANESTLSNIVKLSLSLYVLFFFKMQREVLLICDQTLVT